MISWNHRRPIGGTSKGCSSDFIGRHSVRIAEQPITERSVDRYLVHSPRARSTGHRRWEVLGCFVVGGMTMGSQGQDEGRGWIDRRLVGLTSRSAGEAAE